MIRAAVVLIAALMLSGCAGPAEPVWAPDAAIERVRYVHAGPAKLTLFTVVTTRSGSGGHSALMVNADERLIFDPAGTFEVAFVPERNDVLHGITPRALAAYIDYHARPSHDVIVHEVTVTPEQARRAARLMRAHGAVPKARCAVSVAEILSGVPGFEGVTRTYFPNRLAESFATRPGVRMSRITDATADTSHNVVFERPARR